MRNYAIEESDRYLTRYSALPSGGLSDEQWEEIKGLLVQTTGDVGATAKDNLLFAEAGLYRYLSEISWRDLPERFGLWKAVHTSFSRWAVAGVWKKVFDYL
ncbi:transposase [Glaciimonas sp. GG7]